MTVQTGNKRTKPKSEWWLGEQHFPVAFKDGRFEHVQEQDQQFTMVVHLGLVEDKVACIGIDIRSFMETKTGPKPFPDHEGFAELNSPMWRSIPVGYVIDGAIARQRQDNERMAAQARSGYYDEHVDDPERVAAVHDELATTPARRRPGRTPMLSEQVLRDVVATAYRSGGRRPTVAVQDALTAIGFPGASPEGTVTIDQARKAVQQARQIGAIPAAKTTRRVR